LWSDGVRIRGVGGAVNDDAFLACVRVDVRVVGAGVGAGAGGGLSAIPVEGGLVTSTGGPTKGSFRRRRLLYVPHRHEVLSMNDDSDVKR